MRLLFTLLCLVSLHFAQAQKDFLNESVQQKSARMEWWRDATFGMFIHWGPYAVPAGEYNGKDVNGVAEWICIPVIFQ